MPQNMVHFLHAFLLTLDYGQHARPRDNVYRRALSFSKGLLTMELITHPHILVHATIERFLPTRATFLAQVQPMGANMKNVDVPNFWCIVKIRSLWHRLVVEQASMKEEPRCVRIVAWLLSSFEGRLCHVHNKSNDECILPHHVD